MKNRGISSRDLFPEGISVALLPEACHLQHSEFSFVSSFASSCFSGSEGNPQAPLRHAAAQHATIR